MQEPDKNSWKDKQNHTTRAKTRADTEAAPACSKVWAQLVRVALLS